MKIEIDDRRLAELRHAVSAGHFANVEEAVNSALDSFLVASEDISWAKPLVDEALAEKQRGEGIPLDEFKLEIAAHLARLER